MNELTVDVCEVDFPPGSYGDTLVSAEETVQEVIDEVKYNIDALAPGGGFVFNTVHNIQAEVPPENIMAMWDTFMEYK